MLRIKFSVVLRAIVCTAACMLNGCIQWNTGKTISADFWIGYVNHEIGNNIYYKKQGVFNGCCYEAYWNDQFIFAKVYHRYFQDSIRLYVIDQDAYAKRPFQEQSTGLAGPVSKHAWDSISTYIGFSFDTTNNYYKIAIPPASFQKPDLADSVGS